MHYDKVSLHLSHPVKTNVVASDPMPASAISRSTGSSPTFGRSRRAIGDAPCFTELLHPGDTPLTLRIIRAGIITRNLGLRWMNTLRSHAVALYALFACCNAALLAQDAGPQAIVFPKRVVALAFLGSRLKFKTVIAPLLSQYHFHATLFVDEPRPSVADDLGTGMRHMTWPEIANLSGTCGIGNFTAHPETENGEWTMWPRPEQLRELDTVERHCEAAGIPKPDAVFYPMGMADPGIFQLLVEKGYSAGLLRLPPRKIDFYIPAIDHPLLIPSVVDPVDFYPAADQARSSRFPRDRILVLTLDSPSNNLGWGGISARLKFLADEKFTVLSIGDVLSYAKAGAAMRARRYWDMRYAEPGAGLVFSEDPKTEHWYMDRVAQLSPEPSAEPPPRPHIPTPLERRLDAIILPRVDFAELPLNQCIDFLSEASGQAAPVNFLIAGSLDVSTPISLRLANVPLLEVIRYLADLANASYSVDAYAVTLSPRPAASWRPSVKTPATFLQIAALENLTLPEVHLKGATLGAALDSLHRQAQSRCAASVPDFVIDPDVDLSTPLTLELTQAPYTEILRYVSFLAGVSFSVERHAISVSTAPNPAGAIGPITPASDTESIDLEDTKIPQLDVTDATLDSVMEFLTHKLEAASGGAIHLPFVADPALKLSTPVTLHVRNMPMTEVLRYVGELGRADFEIEQYAIVARPRKPKPNEPAPEIYAAPTPFALVQ